MKKFITSIALFVLLFGNAFASVTYMYTGASALTTEPGAGSISGGVTVGTAPLGLSVLTFQMTVDLAVNRPFSSVGASSWAISDGAHSYSSSLSLPNANQYFMFSTDSVGAITEWDIVVSTYNDATCDSSCAYFLQDFNQLRTINLPFASVPFAFDNSLLFSAVSGDFGRAWDYNALAADAPGTWLMMAVQDGGRIPEPATLALLSIGLLGLGVGTRKRTAA